MFFRNNQDSLITLFTYSRDVGFGFRETFIGNPFFRFSHHFGGDGEIVISIVCLLYTSDAADE